MSQITQRYKLIEPRGKDIFSTTYAGLDTQSRPVYITQFHNKWLSTAVTKALTGAIHRLSTVTHSAILIPIDFVSDTQHFSVVYDAPSDFFSFETSLKKTPNTGAKTYLAVLKTVLSGLCALERAGLYHGHLNFQTLWVSDNTPKLANALFYDILLTANRKSISKYDNAVFLAPEQLAGQSGSAASDIFSFGVFGYALLSHRWPVPYTSTFETLHTAYRNSITPFHPVEALPEAFSLFFGKTLQWQAHYRFADLSQCQDAFLLACGTPTQHEPMPPEPTPQVAADPPQPQRVFPWKWIILPQAVLLGFGLFLYIAYGIYMSYLPIKRIPDVSGLTVAEATTVLTDMGLRVDIGGYRSSPLPTGSVLETRPPAGREVKDKRLIQLIIATPIGTIEVPDFEGRTFEQAHTLATQLGLTVSVVSEIYSPTVDITLIVSQDVTPNTHVSPNSMIGVVVSQGLAPSNDVDAE